MKKIERLELKLVWEMSEEKYRYSVYDKLNELIDAHNELMNIVNLLLKRDEENCFEKAKAELLDTHTVTIPEGKWMCSRGPGFCEDVICKPSSDTHTVKEEDCYEECNQETNTHIKECVRFKTLVEPKPGEPSYLFTARVGKIIEMNNPVYPPKEEPTTPEKKHGKGLCDTYHPDDCCTENPKCDFYELKTTTTPEKKCCEWNEGNDGGIYHLPTCPKYGNEKPTHQKELPTSSYEVTCGRCEKSIKHSCGRV